MNQNFDFLDSNLVEKFTGAGDSMELSLSDSVDNEEGDEKSSGTNNIVCSDGAIAGTMIGAPILIKSQGDMDYQS